jgi:excisionase family DNA binding protein
MITAEIGPLTPMEVAKYLGIHVNTVKRIPACELPYMRVTNRGDRRYHPEDVQAYIDQRTGGERRPDQGVRRRELPR